MFVATVVLFALDLMLVFVDDPVMIVFVSGSPNPEAIMSPISLDATSFSKARNITPRCVRFIAVISSRLPLALGKGRKCRAKMCQNLRNEDAQRI
jgi:hypothetical protein